MNTFTRTLTYLLRCNTDVTSLLSGTALKAVVAYVTEYITKSGLKTYHVFDAVRNTIEKNGELLGGDIKRQEKAKTLMTKIVNSLTSQSEIGAPMASLYLLENPDHYTSHEFKPCYWKNYVRKVTECFDKGLDAADMILDDTDEKVTVKKIDERYVGVSYVDDYQYRPRKWEDMTLYSWIRLAVKDEMSKSEKALMSVDDVFGDGEDSGEDRDGQGELDMDVEFDECGTNKDQEDATVGMFLKGHPQWKTHWMKVVKDDGSLVPNFIGGNLPRRDQGDRELYCATMLTLFKPWRTGHDLKMTEENWDDSFHRHAFPEEALNKMKFFNVKYECLDARDDFHAQRKAMGGNLPGGFSLPDYPRDDGGEVIHDNGMPSADLNDFMDKFLKDTPKGEMHRLSINKTLTDIKRILLTSGWLDACPDGPVELEDFTFRPTAWHTPAHWHAAVQAKRQQVLAERVKGLNSEVLKKKRNGLARDFPNDEAGDSAKVGIVNKAWLDGHFTASDPEVAKMISGP
ncbi:hypothetical protein HWV62_19165, partial [Athelia sp. TMB]